VNTKQRTPNQRRNHVDDPPQPDTTATPQQFVAALTDFGPRRSKLFGNSADEYDKMHDQGPDHAEVTDGSRGVSAYPSEAAQSSAGCITRIPPPPRSPPSNTAVPGRHRTSWTTSRHLGRAVHHDGRRRRRHKPRRIPALTLRLMALYVASFTVETTLRVYNSRAKQEPRWLPRYPTHHDGMNAIHTAIHRPALVGDAR
jgi:hypothetical protein